ncbi:MULTISPECIES: cytochrome c5 family protein [unclassified Oleiphilus]|jgi:cytochrome c5|uniref:c-type cytochrome n=1 Tax=unclassified Oleiphilus TaxID=2631174 RepID=UPI0007C251AB|nr:MULTISPECIES: c-type cytochrome [unclassified Oleiphilus]KZY46075.1 hypothetical protein A3732_01070 [Oleiphilus sp. HI0050]KZY72658.1 hypothetical protein A3740_20700 [Oleiphilus sp. HI0068]KZY76575.1 hypothetical protein A3741_10830 [Oleiphilus sp. HI0069]KZY88800.1 hypothetical protein A3743_10445 [Oleiphilus sp. HI0072]KZZ20477.1 hypothetical protein A3752_01535 [Oleiphilus sp. HI0081]KZZ20993.1 hypothetical protein A3749_18360 [Oleiphilus sp. HI0078]KZZ33114.1 hypothetical protein A3
MTHLKITFLVLLFLSINMTACSSDSPEGFKNISWSAQSLPKDLQRIYQQSCKNCHANSGTGAPLTGDSKTWNKILENGIDASVEKAINGSGGMPPGGQCFECTPDHFVKLIRYMSKPLEQQL